MTPELQFLGNLTFFCASFFPFCPVCRPPLFLPFSRPLFAFLSPLKSALFCRGQGTAQSLERDNSGMHHSAKFGKEFPSRNLREKRSVMFTLLGDGLGGRIGNFPHFQGFPPRRVTFQVLEINEPPITLTLVKFLNQISWSGVVHALLSSSPPCQKGHGIPHSWITLTLFNFCFAKALKNIAYIKTNLEN